MPKKSEVATICFIKDISTSVEKVSHDIKILATNGKVKANRCLLQMASPIIRRNLEYNQKADVLDLQDYSVETVKSLLKLIYVGKLSCQSNALKEEVLDVANELEIKTSVSIPDKPKKVKVKNEDSVITDCGDGKFICGLCFKTFASKRIGMNHYQELHMGKEPVECLYSGCNKKFAVQRYMKEHMKKVHVKTEFIPNLAPIQLEENCEDKERFLMLEQYIGLNNDTGLEQCKVCSKSYKGGNRSTRSTRLRKLFDHVERLHLKLRSYACEYCSHTFNSKGQKASHVSLKHQSGRSAQCSDKKVKKPLKLAILKESEREPAKPAEQ